MGRPECRTHIFAAKLTKNAINFIRVTRKSIRTQTTYIQADLVKYISKNIPNTSSHIYRRSTQKDTEPQKSYWNRLVSYDGQMLDMCVKCKQRFCHSRCMLKRWMSETQGLSSFSPWDLCAFHLNNNRMRAGDRISTVNTIMQARYIRIISISLD